MHHPAASTISSTDAGNGILKDTLRRELRALRRSLEPHRQRQLAHQLAGHLRARPLVVSAARIGLYMPNDGEISPLPLLATLWRAGRTVYLPRVLDNGTLAFHAYRHGDRLRRGRYGIPEPDRRAPETDPCKLDVVLMPLVAFDRFGTRLGMGGGYYDRTFRRSHRYCRPVRIGLGFSLQENEQLPRDPWDRRLDYVVTEKGWRRC